MTWTFEGIKAEIKTRLSLLSNWSNTLYHGVYERIIDVIAYIIEKVVYVAEFYYRESTWSTAQRIESLARECELLSYNYHRKIGAYGNIIISSDPSFSDSNINALNDTSIPRWSLFTNEAGTINAYCTATTIYYRNAEGNQEVPVREGIPRSYLYAAEGIADEIIKLYPTDVTYGIDNEEVDVYIAEADGTILYEVTILNNLYFTDDLENYYCTVKNVPDFSYVEIKFGDGIYTPRLSSGQYVLIKYAETLGDQGNIQSADTITVISSTLTDTYGTDVTNSLYVTNEEEISDGSDFESIESIRNNAPNLFQSGYRAGCKDDWSSIINAISYIYKSIVWTVEDTGGSTLISAQNTVYVTAVTTDGNNVTDSQKTDIELNYLDEEKSPTESITWQDLEKIYAFFDVTAKINTSTSDVIDTQIKDALSAQYVTGNTNFQTNIYESNYNGVINTVSDIAYHVTDLYHMEKNVAKTNTDQEILVSYTGDDTSGLDDQVWLVEDSMRLYIKQKISNGWTSIKQIGASSGTLFYSTMPSSFTITGGTVNYTYNQYSYILTSASGTIDVLDDVQNPGTSDPDGYILYLTYQTQDGNGLNNNCIRLPQRYQITDVDEDFVMTSISYI